MSMGGKAGEIFTDINVTPLTDVFLVLLVIMILIAPLVNQAVLKVDPPSQGSAKPNEEKGPKIDVHVTAANAVILNNQNIDPPTEENIARAIQAEQQKAGKEDIPVNLQSDGDALQKYVVAVMDAAAGCKIKQFRVLPIKLGR